MRGPTPPMSSAGGPPSTGPGLKNGCMRVKRYDSPSNASFAPFCQQSKIARSACTYSRMRGIGGVHGVE